MRRWNDGGKTEINSQQAINLLKDLEQSLDYYCELIKKENFISMLFQNDLTCTFTLSSAYVNPILMEWLLEERLEWILECNYLKKE